MSDPKTLLDLAGVNLPPAELSKAALVMIDLQNEYRSGPLALHGIENALAAAQNLLQQARAAGAPVIHIAHRGAPGGAFDRAAARGQIADAVAPANGEIVIEKPKPNAFADTDLHGVLEKTGRKDLILAGFMTHMCVSSTTRAAFDLGYANTIVSQTCATRDLPRPGGGAVSATALHDAALAALADRFACIVGRIEDLPR